MARAAALVVAATAAPLVVAPAGVAHDSLAPPGSGHHWTPDQDWVHRHWIPFDVQTLKRELGLPGDALEAYLYDDHRTLAALARVRGLHVGRLADRLIEPWRPQVVPERLMRLRRRTRLILTQGHLAQHMFFHRFHGSYVRRAAPGLLGVPSRDFWLQRLSGRTALQVAREHGVAESTMTAGLVAVFQADHEAGIHRQMAWPASSDWFLAEQIAGVACWMRKPLPSLDPTNPYGKASKLHGRHHRRNWPRTHAEQRINEARVEQFRTALKRSCWTRPQAWTWHRTARTNGRPAACRLSRRTVRARPPEHAHRRAGRLVPATGM